MMQMPRHCSDSSGRIGPKSLHFTRFLGDSHAYWNLRATALFINNEENPLGIYFVNNAVQLPVNNLSDRGSPSAGGKSDLVAFSG